MTHGGGEILTLVVYYGVLALLAFYGAHRGQMVWLYRRHRDKAPRPLRDLEPMPRVTVQLPIFNEVYVVERLIEAVAALDYPRHLLEIQILDDSTDETRAVAQRVARRLAADGFDVTYRPRAHRRGYKAGALEEGRDAARGEFLAIFDADFVPCRRFLLEALPHFAEPRVGMVQARWDHLNRDYSLLTRIQAIFLDGHFVIEHAARHRSGRFFNFNGTAGVWRRECLEDAGGWQSDTLTEDLDVSYRAQLAGWRFVYLEDLAVPAELPVEMDGFKTQQHRWTKGSIQTGRKLLPAILRSALPAKIKLEAFFHLTNNVSYLLVVLLALLIVPAILIRERIGWQRLAFLDFPLFFGATFSFLAFYFSSQKQIGRPWTATLRTMPLLLSLGIGLSVNNARAVLEAVFDRRSGFSRTPKYRIEGDHGEWRGKKYRAAGGDSVVAEALLAVYFLGAILFSARENYWAGIPFLLIFFNGFAYTAAWSLLSRWQARPLRRPPAASAISEA